jgi:hypothetical protein
MTPEQRLRKAFELPRWEGSSSGRDSDSVIRISLRKTLKLSCGSA